MKQPARILVATDLSEGSDEALREGALIARQTRAALAVVHVMPALEPIRMLFPQGYAGDALRASDVTGRATSAVRARVATIAGDGSEVFVEEGTDYACIVKRADAWNADLIIVGSHGRAGLHHVFGGVAEHVVRYAHCAVLVARHRPRNRGAVLVATDLSKPSLPAIAAGAAEALRRETRLKVVHAVGFLRLEASYLLGHTGGARPKESDLAAIGRELEQAVAERATGATCEILGGAAGPAIIRDASAIDAELVVVGTRGKSGLTRVLLGSVAEKVVRDAPCSVLVVREPSATHHE